MRLRTAVCAALVTALSFPSHPCAILALVEDGHVFLGNNEDFHLPGVIWFVPGRNGRYGRVNVGFETDFAQGSMNEAGLAFDAAAVPEVPWEPDPAKETPANLIERIMFECATVAEAIDYFERYNCPHLADSQFLFADATGAAAVIAWLPGTGLDVRRMDGDHTIATNTRLGMSGYRCPRWTKAHQILSGGGGIDAVSRALDAIHQEGAASTTYSTIYDLKRRTIRLYNLSNFDEYVEFGLAAELDKGRHALKMKTLMDANHTLDELTKRPAKAYNTRVELEPAVLAAYAGRYQPEGSTVVIEIRAEDPDLIWSIEGEPDARLFPESERTFRIAPDQGQVSFTTDSSGAVTGLTLHRGGDGHARRLPD